VHYTTFAYLSAPQRALFGASRRKRTLRALGGVFLNVFKLGFGAVSA
jgi:hypothetical protein